MGGMGFDTAPQALVRVYEAAKDHWQPLSSMPTPRYAAAPFVRGKKIYLMGTSHSCACLNVSIRGRLRPGKVTRRVEHQEDPGARGGWSIRTFLVPEEGGAPGVQKLAESQEPP